MRNIERFVADPRGRTIPGEGHHYAALNTHALSKFGSIEIRSMRGITNAEEGIKWLNLLEKIYHNSRKFADPRQLLETFSVGGTIHMLNSLLGDQRQALVEGLPSNFDIRQSLLKGMRQCQRLANIQDWSQFEARPVNVDIFGRPLDA